MGTFDGLQIGSTGLGAQRRGVETAGQNIANVNTEGYTRQRVDITADSGPITPAFHSTWSASGLGVRSVEVTRLRDAFVDSRARDEAALHAELGARAQAFQSVERIFSEPSDQGLSAVLADFLAAWDDLANNPGDIGTRTQVVERGVTLATDLNRVRASLTGLQENTRTSLETTIREVNTDAVQVAKLQEAIATANAAGIPANELLDQRDLLLERIVSKVGGTVNHEPDGTATLFIGGTALVRGSTAVELRAVEHADGTSSVTWALDGRSAPVGGGAAGMLHVVNDLIPGYVADVGALAEQLATGVNEVQGEGFDRDGLPGLDFFVWDGEKLSVSAALVADPGGIAVSRVAPGPPPNDGGNLDNSNVSHMLDRLQALEGGYRELMVGLGVSSQSAQRRLQLQGNVVSHVRAEQEAANGVNLDEELSDLVRFQRAFEASSRFISAVDELLDTLINGTGRVGR